ncbi:acylneuraminate cytidylyltransferase family protein [Pseudoalteromonas piscicida]|uniref:acylneuraminate cytidylyltransferase family protein n=1 Tax=Pseudoalteromonas piscicida TaxID=43662 RepID=UPI001FD08298|nr:acylneuraminate cytidylyltransferase family protein [Pseudoalteromonas piscicida]
MLGSKHLIGWSIDAAKKSKYIDEIMVTTDCEEIARISGLYGAQPEALRPAHLASDEATTRDTVLYCIEQSKSKPDVVIVLQPTSPLRNEQHIDEALELFEKRSANSIISVTKCEHNPWWSNRLADDHSLSGFLRSDPQGSSGEYYRLNGAIYISAVPYYKSHESLYKEGSFAYLMKREFSVDIDTEEDFHFAEFLIEKRGA